MSFKTPSKWFIIFVIFWTLLTLDITVKPAIIEGESVSFVEFFTTERFTPTYPLQEIPNSSKNVTPIINADNKTTQLILDILNRTDPKLVSQIDSINIMSFDDINFRCNNNTKVVTGCIISIIDSNNTNFTSTNDIFVTEPSFWDLNYTTIHCSSFKLIMVHEIGHLLKNMIKYNDSYEEDEKFAKNYAKTMTNFMERGIC